MLDFIYIVVSFPFGKKDYLVLLVEERGHVTKTYIAVFMEVGVENTAPPCSQYRAGKSVPPPTNESPDNTTIMIGIS